jgi:hypothetical protein
MKSYPSYAPIPTQEFDAKLTDKVQDIHPIELFQIPGIYEILAEHFNNDIMEDYEDSNAHYRCYEDVVEEFEEDFLPNILKQYGDADDNIATLQAWKDWIETLWREDEISVYAYENWTYGD